MTRSRLLALAPALAGLVVLAGCHHPIAAPADAGKPDGGGADGGGDAGPITSFDAGPVTISVRAIFPGQGPAAGGQSALVSGAGFVNGFAARGGASVSAQTTVTIGGAKATSVDVIDDNRLQLVVPPGAGGPADVTVQNPNGSGSCAGCYRYRAALTVSSIAPAQGASRGGTAVTIRGQGFAQDMLLLVGGRALINLQMIDSQTAAGLTPPGSAGGADVLALTRDATGELARGFLYLDPLQALSVDPAAGPVDGGTAVTIQGAGFSADAVAWIGSAPADALWIDAGALSAVTPPHAPGPADVTVSEPDGGSATLPHGFFYDDGSGALRLAQVTPSRGPLEGGTALTLWGSGLAQPGLAVAIGGAQATVTSAAQNRLTATAPAGAQPGPVDVSVTAGGVTATLAGGFRYDQPLSVIQISPASGAAAGGTAVAISGAGFAPGMEVRIGALDALQVVVASDGRSVSAITPPGSAGPADVTLVLADGTTRTLSAGYRYTAPLQLLQLEPASGAQAGGTRVTLFGQGFAPGLAVSFGGRPAAGVQVLGPAKAVVQTPRGDPGAVEVSVTLGAERDALPQGFTFFDPVSAPGGTGGGPLRGTLNVTAIESSAFLTGGVAGATVAVELHGGGRLTALTDSRGQVTFSDARLALPCTVTVTKAQYNAFTAAAVATENLSVFLSGPAGAPPPPPDPPPPPPPPQRQAQIGGHVYGFKVPPSLQLSPSQRLVARVQPTASSVYGAPPFALPAKFTTITQDGGSWSYATYRLSPTTVFALFGIEDRATNPPGFTPLLLGIRRGITPSPDKPITDADIILDTHLDQAVDAQVLGVPSTPRGPVGHDAAVDLDLGTSGVIPLAHLVQDQPLGKLRFEHLPRASGQGLVFVDIVGLWAAGQVSLPATTYLRRVFSDPGPGLTLGPLLPFPVLTSPADQGALTPAGFTWQVDGALQPNLIQLQLNGAPLSFSAVLPGDARALVPPPEIAARLAAGTYVWSVTSSLAPAFDFTHWTYNDLYSGSWTAYAYDVASFKVGP